MPRRLPGNPFQAAKAAAHSPGRDGGRAGTASRRHRAPRFVPRHQGPTLIRLRPTALATRSTPPGDGSRARIRVGVRGLPRCLPPVVRGRSHVTVPTWSPPSSHREIIDMTTTLTATEALGSARPLDAATQPAAAARVLDAVKTYGSRRQRGPRPRRRHRPVRDRSLHRDHGPLRFRASRRSCTASPGSTRSRRARSASATSTSRRLDDRRLTELRRDRIGFIFQAFNLVPTLTAAENIMLPARLAGRKVERDWFDHVVDTVGLANRLGHRPSELSGGQQQRVAVARALVARARRSSSPTSRPATSTRTAAARCCRSCASPCASSARRS